MYRTIIALAIGAIITTNHAYAKSLSENPGVAEALKLVEVWLNAQRDYDRIPGISVGIVHDQDLIWSDGFGFANLEDRIPATPRTKYSICSISKLFTSIALMQLRDEGLVRLDDPPSKHLPWFSIEQAYPNGPSITLESLLTHSSGLPRESDFPYWSPPNFDFPSREEMKKRLSTQKTLYPASEYFQYSNLGLTLVGEVVAEVSGMSYDEYIQNQILSKLKMKDTSTMLPENEWGNQLAIGYTALNRKGVRNPIPIFQAEAIAPAAGFFSTVEDLARFASWQFKTLAGKESNVLNSNTLKEMHRVHWVDPDWSISTGLGFAVMRENNLTLVGHGGSCPGYTTQLLLEPRSKIAVIFLTNASGVSTAGYAKKIIEIMEPAVRKAEKKSEKPTESKIALDEFVGTYNAQPWWGEVAVLQWEGKLVTLRLPTMKPLKSMMKFKHIKGNVFKRLRANDVLGEEMVFELDDIGRVKGFSRHSSSSVRIR